MIINASDVRERAIDHTEREILHYILFENRKYMGSEYSHTTFSKIVKALEIPTPVIREYLSSLEKRGIIEFIGKEPQAIILSKQENMRFDLFTPSRNETLSVEEIRDWTPSNPFEIIHFSEDGTETKDCRTIGDIRDILGTDTLEVMPFGSNKFLLLNPEHREVRNNELRSLLPSNEDYSTAVLMVRD